MRHHAVAGLAPRAAAALGLAASAAALNNGLARTPPLGYNTWSAYGPAGASAAVLEQVADLFISTGLAAAGYSYVNMDDGEHQRMEFLSSDGNAGNRARAAREVHVMSPEYMASSALDETRRACATPLCAARLAARNCTTRGAQLAFCKLDAWLALRSAAPHLWRAGISGLVAAPFLLKRAEVTPALPFLNRASPPPPTHLCVAGPSSAGWSLTNRSVTGQLVPDPAKFPSGVGAVADYVHARGLKLGIYTAVAPFVCSGRPGSLHHELDDAALFASMSVDYVKIDNCGSSAMGDARFLAFAEAANRTGRAMVLSTEPFNILPSPSHARFSNMWRTQADLGPSWDQILTTMDMNEQWWPVAGPGAWADPDMLQCDRGEIGNGPLCRSHFAAWAVAKAPLLISTALTALTNETLGLYKNAGLLRVNQDALGVPARKLAAGGERMPFFVGVGACEGGGGGVNGVTEAAMGFALAPSPANASLFALRHDDTGRCLGVRAWPEAGAAAAPVLLPCDAADATQAWWLPLGAGTPGAIVSPAAGGLALAVSPGSAYAAAHGSDAALPDGAYGVSNVTLVAYNQTPPCVIPHSGCNTFDPLQLWHASALTGKLHLGLYAATQEHCFSAAPAPGTCYPPPGSPQLPATTQLCLSRVFAAANAPALGSHAGQHVWGGPLAGGDFVVMLQNRDAGAAASVAARWAWLEAPGVGDNTTFCGTELINGTALGALVGGVALEVGARDVSVIRLTPGSSC
jgi:alpha-galactosidase